MVVVVVVSECVYVCVCACACVCGHAFPQEVMTHRKGTTHTFSLSNRVWAQQKFRQLTIMWSMCVFVSVWVGVWGAGGGGRGQQSASFIPHFLMCKRFWILSINLYIRASVFFSFFLDVCACA